MIKKPKSKIYDSKIYLLFETYKSILIFILTALLIISVGSTIGGSIGGVQPDTTIHLLGDIGKNNWYWSNVIVNFTAIDNSGSGINFTKYRINNGSWINYSSNFTIINEGLTTIDYYSVDNNSNNESIKTNEIKIDKYPPTLLAPLDKTIEAKPGYNLAYYFRYPATMDSELNKFTNLLGVYSSHIHYNSDQIFQKENNNKVRYITINGLSNAIDLPYNVTPSNEVGFTIIDGNNITYKLIPYNSSENAKNYTNSSGISINAIKFITIGDPHIDNTDPDTINRLKQVVNFINASDVDFAVFMGDISDDKSIIDFTTAKDILKNLNKTYYTIAGTHDVAISIPIDYGNVPGNWITSDKNNTRIVFENNIKQEGLGSLKIITNGANSVGDTIISTFPEKNLSGFKYIEFWIRSNISGNNIIKAGFGEDIIRENELSINIIQPNVWQKIVWDIDAIPNSNKDNMTKFGFTVTGNKSVDIYVDNIIGVNNKLYESYFGPQNNIINFKGYQLLFVGLWKEANKVPYWDFDFDNPSINKNTPTLVFTHGIMQSLLSEELKTKLGLVRYNDSVDPNPKVSNDFLVDGFKLGNMSVTWTATDQSGRSSTDIQKVILVDTTKPFIYSPGNITRVATGNKTFVDLGELIASDIVDLNPIISNDAPLGGFSIGSTMVTWTVTDKSGNSNTSDQYITIINNTGNNSVNDTIPPASVTSLFKKSYGPTFVNWTWTDPKDKDFEKVMIYINNKFVGNVTKGIRYYNATNLIPYTTYRISTHTVDLYGNINNTWRNNTAKTAKDNTIPNSITNLTNVSITRTSIKWTWNDPKDYDFSKVMIYINGVFKTNITKGIETYSATGLINNKNYTISTHTVDTSGNINKTWVNNTAKTLI